MARYSKELSDRGIRLTEDAMDKHPSRWVASEAIAKKLGCSTQRQLNAVAKSLNSGPRKVLGFKSPLQVFSGNVALTS